MKKIILLLATVLFANHGNAQQFHAGARAGLNFAQMNALGWQSNYSTAPFGGLYAQIGNRRLALHIEGLLGNQSVVTDTSFKGLYAQYSDSIFYAAKSGGKFTLTKLNVPVYATFKFNKNFWLQFGAIYNNTLNVVDKNDFLKTTKQVFATNDIHLSGGLWLGFAKKYSVSARYAQGVADFNNLKLAANGSTGITGAWHNQFIQLGVGYKFF